MQDMGGFCDCEVPANCYEELIFHLSTGASSATGDALVFSADFLMIFS
ncbi:MAG: hypothetical protein IJZ74_11410 [Clostridia bacterium]|nr:hypothetical protein [Clostridia bacterium]